jgi:hypothetical protein
VGGAFAGDLRRDAAGSEKAFGRTGNPPMVLVAGCLYWITERCSSLHLLRAEPSAGLIHSQSGRPSIQN